MSAETASDHPPAVFFSPGVLAEEVLGHWLRRHAEQLMERRAAEGLGVAALEASELLLGDMADLAARATRDTIRYLVILDVPVPAALRVPAALGLRKPERRVHLTGDVTAVRRLIISQTRRDPAEGIVDAYVLGPDLVLVLGDLSIRKLPLERLSILTSVDQPADFRIDVDGAFLEWREADLHLDASGLLDEVDPERRARRELQALRRDHLGPALTRMREDAGLRQTDIADLSARHVRRIENGVSRLTLDAARRFAAAFDLSLPEFLERLATRVTEERLASVDSRC